MEKTVVNQLELEDTGFHLLDEMEKLARSDLIQFFNHHRIRLPSMKKEKILDEIMEKSKGRYEMTLEALKDIVDRAFDFSYEDTELSDSEDEEPGFGVDD